MNYSFRILGQRDSCFIRNNVFILLSLLLFTKIFIVFTLHSINNIVSTKSIAILFDNQKNVFY